MSLGSSSEMAPEPQWDPSDLLDLYPNSYGFRCVGIALTKNSPCRIPIDYQERLRASKVLRKISGYAPTSSAVHENLHDVAALLLCREWHQNQANGIASQWAENIRKVTADHEERQMLRSEVNRLKRIIEEGHGAQAHNKESQSQRTELHAEMMKLKDELLAVEKEKRKWMESNKEQAKQVDELSSQVMGLQSRSAEIQSDLRRCEHDRATLEAERTKLLSQKDDLERDLATAHQKDSDLWWEAADKQLESETRKKADHAKITELVQQIDNIKLKLVKGHLVVFCREARSRVASKRLEDAKQSIIELNDRIASSQEREQVMQTELEKARTEQMENFEQLRGLRRQIDSLQAEMADLTSKATQREAEVGDTSATDKAKIRRLSQRVEELEHGLSTSRWRAFCRSMKLLNPTAKVSESVTKEIIR